MTVSRVDSKSSVSAEHARFESAAMYLALGPSASSKQSQSLEHSLSESSIMPPAAVTSSTSFKRAYSPEQAKPNDDGPSIVLPVSRPAKRSRIDSNISANLPPPLYTGNLDLYAMFLPFLYNVYLPKGVTAPQYQSLYKTLLSFQAKPDHSARCFLAPPCNPAGSSSRFESLTMIDPMTEMPYDIEICTILPKKTLSFAPNTERASFAHPEASSSAPGPGISAKTSLPDQCGIKSSKGVFKMKRVWAKMTPGGVLQELFEGFFSFNVSFDNLYKKAGHGNGAKYKYAFWAIRASAGLDGREIGLGPRTAGIGR